VKGKARWSINPYSTGITLQLIPKAPVDKIPVLSMGYGLSAAVGETPSPGPSIRPTPTGTVSSIVKYIARRKAAQTSRARRSAYIYP
jgi:branched-chain amino acid transport system substrate-binding protein